MSTDMNTLFCMPQTPSKVVADTTQLYQTLIVLIPPGLDTSLLSHRIWQLAHATGMHVLLLSLVGKEANIAGLRREMVTLLAMLQREQIPIDMLVETGTNWVDIVKLHCQPGDMIFCPAGYRTGKFHQPLRQILEAKLSVPTYVLPIAEARPEASNWNSELLTWSGFIGFLSGFGLLQLGIVRSTSGGFQTILLVLSTCLEFWLFGVWNKLTR